MVLAAMIRIIESGVQRICENIELLYVKNIDISIHSMLYKFDNQASGIFIFF